MREAVGATPLRVECDICGQIEPFSSGTYGVQKNAAYEIFVCATCNGSDNDSWEHRDATSRLQQE